MEILNASLHIIDLDKKINEWRKLENDMKELLPKIITNIDINKNIKQYKKRDSGSYVLEHVENLINEYANMEDNEIIEENFKICSSNIANKLLECEIFENDRLQKTLKTHLQRGSIIQAVIYNESRNMYSYFIAKLEHTEFISQDDLIKRIGFESSNNNIWKSAKIQFTDDFLINKIELFKNNSAKYWNNSFLEVDELTSDEYNSKTVFEKVENLLVRKTKKKYPSDFYVLRNALIKIMKTSGLISYNNIITELLDEYHGYAITDLEINNIKDELLTFPQKYKFDTQFNRKPSVIKARKHSTFQLNKGIELIIGKNEYIDDFSNTIQTTYIDGKPYIQIYTTNSDALNAFNRQQ